MTQSTCWTMIDAAASGQESARDEFARRYLGPVRAYLAARWRSPVYRQLEDDAVQEVFVQCFREGGSLERAGDVRKRFRDYYLGIVRNVAAEFERRLGNERKHIKDQCISHSDVICDETSLSDAFDQSWARCMLERAIERHGEIAAERGDPDGRRVDLLRMRFEEELPIREIARVWNTAVAHL